MLDSWFAEKSVLKAVQNNLKLPSLSARALSNTTEMMVLIAIYDRLYDDRKIAHSKKGDPRFIRGPPWPS